MHRNTGARILLVLGFLAASVSYSSWVVSRTALDPEATRAATHALITAPAVRSSLARQLHAMLARELGKAGADAKLRVAANAAVADPRFVAAFDDAIVQIHRSILSDDGARVTLDTHAVTAAVRAAVVRNDPALAPRMRSLGAVRLPLGSDDLPHIGRIAHSVGRVRTTAALLAFMLIGAALLVAHDAKTIGRAGRRVAFLAIGPVVAFVLLPLLLEALQGTTTEIGAAVLRAYGRRVLLSATLLAIAGVSIWLIAAATPVLRRRTRATDSTATQSPAAAPTAPTAFASGHVPPGSQNPLPERLYL